MRSIDLNKINHSYKVGQSCPSIDPNITEDCLLYENGELIGFFINSLTGKIKQCAEFCNNELLSERVPKQIMTRSSGLHNGNPVEQFSTIIGSIPPKPHMRRSYPSISSVHNVKTAVDFIKGMKVLVNMAEELIKEIMPCQYELQKRLIEERVLEKYRFSKLFTSSISNFNISADFHIDKLNIKNCVNVIISKRKDSTGGNLYVPDYDACFNSKDSSILVYPAWKSLHGVTKIVPTKNKGYRNSLVFYPLDAFSKDR
jgi:hypothetical protein